MKGKLSKFGRAAVRYAKKGWYVFPLRPKNKNPILKGGFHAATNNIKQVQAWWTEHPDANIGAAPGLSGYVVLDLDSKRGLREAKQFGALRKPTLECVTGRAEFGRHLYFKRPDFDVSNNKLAEHIDIRGDNGYVVLPPSVHPSGKQYRWTDDLASVATLPAHLLKGLRTAQSSSGNGQHAPPLPEVMHEGERNKLLFSIACSMRRRNASPNAILAALGAENADRCKPPLDDREVETIAASAARYEPAATNGNGKQPTGKMWVEQLSKVEAKPVYWLWPSWLPLGQLIVLDGLPGQGKSAVMLNIAARGSRGGKMPDSSRGSTRGPWDTLVLTYEDDPASTLRPRVEAAGGNPKRIRYVKGISPSRSGSMLPATLPKDLEKLEDVLAAKPETRLVVIDPLMAALEREVDSHRDQDIRWVLSRLVAIAVKYNVCIVAIRHTRKATGNNAITAGGGSIGISGQARVVLLIDRHPDKPDVAVLACSKANLGPLPPSRSFRKVEASIETTSGPVKTLQLIWNSGIANFTADELLARREEGSTGDSGKATQEWLREVLRDGALDRKEIMKGARGEGYPERNVDRAATSIGVVKLRSGSGKNTRSVWSLITDDSQPNNKRHSKRQKKGHLP